MSQHHCMTSIDIVSLGMFTSACADIPPRYLTVQVNSKIFPNTASYSENLWVLNVQWENI